MTDDIDQLKTLFDELGVIADANVRLHQELALAESFGRVAVAERNHERAVNYNLQEEIERLHADNQAAVAAYAAEITEAKAEIERLRAALEKAHDVWEAEAAEMRNDIDRLRAELERNTDTALEMAIDACIAIHATTATTHAANSVRSCVDAIRALKDVK